MLPIVRAVVAPLAFMLRLRALRVLLCVLLVVAALASFAVLVAAGWTDGGRAFTWAFLAVFAAAVAGAIVLWRAAIGARSRRTRTLDGLLALSAAGFEAAVADVLRRQGFRDVSVVGGPGDLAADIVCRGRRGAVVAVQCKRKGRGQRVGSAEMQQFIGMITVHHGAHAGIYVTTAGYTQPAAALAAEHGITLIDGAALADLLARKRRLELPAA